MAIQGNIKNNHLCDQCMKYQLKGTMQIYKLEEALERNTLKKSSTQSPPEGAVIKYHRREKYKKSIKERSANTQLEGTAQTATRGRRT